MKLMSMTFGRGQTINTGNFESLRVDARVSYEIAEGDDLQAVRATATRELDESLRALVLSAND